MESGESKLYLVDFDSLIYKVSYRHKESDLLTDYINDLEKEFREIVGGHKYLAFITEGKCFPGNANYENAFWIEKGPKFIFFYHSTLDNYFTFNYFFIFKLTLIENVKRIREEN